ncbi:ion channel [Skermanella stibiiresistens]|nr:ion channel [Skermanella stibiiresistens]
MPKEDARARRLARRRARLHGGLSAVVFTGVLLGLISLSIKTVAGDLAFVLLATVAIVVYIFHRLFPGGEFFTIALANFIGIYASIFVLFVEGNFKTLTPMVQAVGFVMPLAAFVGGAYWKRHAVRTIVLTDVLRPGGRFDRIFLWLLPVIAIGFLTFLMPGHDLAPAAVTKLFLLAMVAISLVVLFVSRDIAIFLLDTGLLFEGFFQAAARLVVPAFAFLTFYSLLVIVFASLYTILDRFTDPPNFVIDGRPRDITFPESLYFSLVTLSTVGYGDIQPHTGFSRLIAATEILLGILLLLFGFSAIISHRTDRRGG